MFESSVAAPVKTCTAKLPGKNFSVVLLRFAMDAMRKVFKVVASKKLHVQSQRCRRSNSNSKDSLRRVEEVNEHEKSKIVEE